MKKGKTLLEVYQEIHDKEQQFFNNNGDNKMDITVEIKNVFGNEAIYPVCAKALLLASLVGTKTLTRESIATIKDLGYVVNVKAQTL